MWNLPGPGIKPVSPALAGRFFTTEPPRKPWSNFRFIRMLPRGQRFPVYPSSGFIVTIMVPLSEPRNQIGMLLLTHCMSYLFRFSFKFLKKLLIFVYLFIFVASCTLWDLRPGIKPMPSVVKVQSFFFFSSTSLLLPTHLHPPSCTRAQSCNPIDFSPPDSSVHGFWQEYWSGLPFPSPWCSFNYWTSREFPRITFFLIPF